MQRKCGGDRRQRGRARAGEGGGEGTGRDGCIVIRLQNRIGVFYLRPSARESFGLPACLPAREYWTVRTSGDLSHTKWQMTLSRPHKYSSESHNHGLREE